MRPARIGVIADDLTGATDTAVQFANAGWSSFLVRCLAAAPIVDGPTALAVATGVRAATPAVASAATAAAVRELARQGCDRIYLKVDSTMRGSVAGQLHGALDAWSTGHRDVTAVLCPAFPAQGRTVAGGVVFVDGVPLADTAARTDPVTPVAESRLDRLVAADSRVRFVDATTTADLAAVAADLDRLGAPVIPVGSAGLAAALAKHWSAGYAAEWNLPRPARRTLVGVSSLHPVAQAGLRSLRAWAGAALDVVTTSAGRTDAVIAAEMFGAQIADRLAGGAYDALVLVGGDGAAAALDRIEATALAVHTTLAPGIPIATIVGGAAHGLPVVTASGGFGDERSLCDVLAQLHTSASPRKESS